DPSARPDLAADDPLAGAGRPGRAVRLRPRSAVGCSCGNARPGASAGRL
ncbi:MAG: hypothetical protein AVDCRST_MAG60-2433, partial [uncultured Nocardioides sp.]